MPRKKKPEAPPRPAGARAERGKGGTAKKKAEPQRPWWMETGWAGLYYDKGKGKRGGKKEAPKSKPKPRPENPPAVPLPSPEDALVAWRKAHPATPPTFTGYNTGDLGGGPMQTAPGAPPKRNGTPLYTPAPPAATPHTSTAPEQVSWGQILSDYYASTAGAPAGWYSDGTAIGSTGQASPYPVRPDINLETAQQMMSKLSGGFYVSGGA